MMGWRSWKSIEQKRVNAMSRPDSHIQEDLNTAYATAIIASAGFQINNAASHEYGNDLIINKVKKMPSGNYRSTGIHIVLQLKSCTNVKDNGDYVTYYMEADALNKIAEWEGESPCILVLFKMPKNKKQWVTSDDHGLLLKDCCYWTKIEESTINTSSKVINIPKKNIFNQNAIINMFNYIDNWDELK